MFDQDLMARIEQIEEKLDHINHRITELEMHHGMSSSGIGLRKKCQEIKKGDRCAEWLKDLLREADEPLSPKDIFEAGKEIGFNKKMIQRVRKKLFGCIRDTMDTNNHPANRWVLGTEDTD